MPDYPRDVVWYVEARDWHTDVQMGSAVAVWLRPPAPGQPRKYLLTARHVVRAPDVEGAVGYGRLHPEILCWAPGHGYTPLEPPRPGGAATGAFAAHVIALDPSVPIPTEVPADDRAPDRDWVLLDVKDPAFQSFDVATSWAEAAADSHLDICGYPGGAGAWRDTRVVEGVTSSDFHVARLASPGTLRLSSASPTASGMSGGGVFDERGRLVGIHCSQTAAQLAFGAVRATTIRDVLAAHGWSVIELPDRVPAPDPGRHLMLTVDLLSSPAHHTRRVTYRSARRGDTLCITPYLDYLDLVARGGPIEPIDFSWTPFEPVLPALDLKLVNNTPATVFVAETVVEVESSRLDPRPLLVIAGSGRELRLPLVNVGFGPVSSCTVRFALAPERDGARAGGPLPFELDATAAVEHGGLDLGPAFATLGVDVAALRNLDDELAAHVVGVHDDEPAPESPDQRRARIERALGPFALGVGFVRGEIAYAGLDLHGAPFARQLAFRAEVSLTRAFPKAPFPPTARYDVELEVDRQGYAVRVPTAHVLKPGEADRFTLHLAAPRASWHRFRLCLRCVDGELIESPPIELELFLTTADHDLVKQRGAPHDDLRHPSGHDVPRRPEP